LDHPWTTEHTDLGEAAAIPQRLRIDRQLRESYVQGAGTITPPTIPDVAPRRRSARRAPVSIADIARKRLETRRSCPSGNAALIWVN
jgi:hypothetical protein